MAVVGSAKRVEKVAWTGVSDAAGKRRVVPYLVETDDYGDGPEIVEAASGLGTELVTTYSAGNDSNSNLVLLKKTSRPDSKNPLLWIVTEEYGPFPNEVPKESKPDSGGNQTTDPDQWWPEFRRIPHTKQDEATKGWNLEQFHPDGNGGNFARAVGTEDPITNVLGERVDPPPFTTYPAATLEVTDWYFELNADTSFLNTEGSINDQNVVFVYTRPWSGLEFRMNADKHTLLVVGYHVQMKRQQGGVEYLEVRATIEYDPNGWNIEVPNESLFERAAAGDKNNKDDTTISASDLSSNRPTVQPQRADPKADDNKLPILRPININGVASEDPLNLGYRVAEEIDFANTIGKGISPWGQKFFNR